MKFASIGSRAGYPPRKSGKCPAAGNAASGFTLFETLTAMLVLSIGLVALFEAHSRALKTAGIAADYLRARIFAQGLLMDTVEGWRRKIVPQQGAANGFAWTIDIAPETSSWAHVRTRDNWKLERVRVTVSWPGGRELELDSLKLVRANG